MMKNLILLFTLVFALYANAGVIYFGNDEAVNLTNKYSFENSTAQIQGVSGGTIKIHTGTASGSDNSSACLTSVGDVDPSRGAAVCGYGNDSGGLSGVLRLISGLGDIEFWKSGVIQGLLDAVGFKQHDSHANYKEVGHKFREDNFFLGGEADYSTLADWSGAGLAGLTINTTSPLVGVNGFTYTLTGTINNNLRTKIIDIPLGYRGGVLEYRFRYTYDGLDSDIQTQVYCVDSTSILSSGKIDIEAHTSDGSALAVGKFKPNDCSQIRLYFNEQASNSGKKFAFARIKITPEKVGIAKVYESSELVNAGPIQIVQTGASPMSKGGIITDTVKYSRQGRWLNATYTYRQNTVGTGGSGIYLFSLPDGLEIDLSVLTANSSTSITNARTGGDIIGRGHAEGGSPDLISTVDVIAHNSTQVKLYVTSAVGDTGTSHAWSNDVVSGDAAFSLAHTNILYKFDIRVPIVGWEDYSEHVVASDSMSGEDVELLAESNNGASIPANVQINFSEITDSHSSWNSHTYTIPQEGVYDITGSVYFIGSVSRVIHLWKNGAYYKRIGASTVSSVPFNYQGKFNDGDTISIRSNVTSTLVVGVKDHHISITKAAAITKANILNLAAPKTAYIKPSASYYGGVGITATTVWKTRTLESISDDANFLSLSSNQITIDAGTYDLAVPVGAYNGTSWMNLNLRNVTDNVDNIFQRVTHANSGDGVTYNTVFTTIIVTKPTIFDFRTISTTASGQEFLGQIKITKVK